ncbi:MAG: hypothetical protein IPJ77_14670 [Planctomycetes bacterium]|nr:hypothetical protein [Planctomycetota bacterium]
MICTTSFLVLVLAAQGYVKRDTRAFDVASADGRFRLHAALVSEVSTVADPACTFTGRGTYQLFEGTTRRWQRGLDCALEDVRVLSDGSVAGLGYGETPARDQDRAHVVFLAPDGTPRLDQRITCEGLGRDFAGCIERVRGWFVDEGERRIAAWSWSVPQKGEVWLVWSLATGKPVEWRPRLADSPASFGCAGAVPVAGTGLVLVHAWVRGERPTLYRSQYHLVDGSGLSTWRFAVDDDRVEGEPGRAAPGANGIVSVEGGAKPGLRVRCFGAKQIVRFELTQDATTKAWTPREIERVATP